jgi:diguanylate cyclase (GGDEF)-like protein
MTLDTATVNLVTVLMIFLECGILGALWSIHRDTRGIAYWALGALAIAVGVLGIHLRDSLPPFVPFVLSNFAVVAGYVLSWWGVDLFFGRRPHWRAGALLLALDAGALVYFGLLAPDTRSRLILLLSLLSLLMALRLHSMLRRILPGTRLSQLLNGGVMLLQLVTELTLLAAAIRFGVSGQSLSQMQVSAWVFLALMVLSVAAVLSVVLLVGQKLETRLREAAQRDQLTGAWRRHVFDEAGEREIARSRRHARPFALLLLDLDHFKAVNDRFGHQAGDEALRRFAAATAACLRREDLLGRTGGEEFGILLPDTGRDGALRLAERVRAAVAALPLSFEGEPLHLTVSIGVGIADGQDDWDSLIRAADVALYRAKNEGRDRVAAAGQPPAGGPPAE